MRRVEIHSRFQGPTLCGVETPFGVAAHPGEIMPFGVATHSGAVTRSGVEMPSGVAAFRPARTKAPIGLKRARLDLCRPIQINTIKDAHSSFFFDGWALQPSP